MPVGGLAGAGKEGRPMNECGTVQAICLSEEKGTVKTAVQRSVLEAGQGFAGDAHAGDGHRQISLLAADDVEAMRAKGLPDLAPGAFGENLVVAGVDLAALGLGSRLAIGADAVLEISQRGKVCHSRCAIYHRTGDCIMPRNGVFARVVEGGVVACGDPVRVDCPVPVKVFQAVVLTIFDKGSRGERVDTAGPAVAGLLEKGLGAHIYGTEILPDDRDLIAARLAHFSNGHSIDLVVAVGGTGFAPRDVTPEAVAAVAERLTPGLDEAMRAASRTSTPHAILSRSVSGVRGSTQLVSLPGSERAASENLLAILPALGHGLAKLRGDGSDCAAPKANRLQVLAEGS